MKIAVTYDNGNVFQHFGKTENFQLFNIEDNQIASSEVITSDGLGHGALAGLLARYQIDVLICGGIGGGARDALAAAGIEVCAGAQGNTEEAVRAYLSGELKGSDESCSHHHEEGHDCGHHDEGHDCGHHDEGHECGGCQGEESGCAGCHGRPEVTGKNAGKTVKVHYRGTLNDGTQFDSSYDRGEPLEFVCGAGMMIFGFDQAVANMEIGETVNVHLMPEEAYGLSNPNAVMVIPMKTLPGSENLEVGQRVMVRDQMGRRFPVRVTAKDETYITLDGNHEMAGRELNFTIELLSAE